MKQIIDWSVKNLTGVNVLLVILVVAGLFSFLSMRGVKRSQSFSSM